MRGKENEENEFSVLNQEGVSLTKELEEITDFFLQIETVKNKILKDKMEMYKSEDNLTCDTIRELLYKNVKLFNVISDDTVRIYIESTFQQSGVNEEYEFTEASLETFLTSILIFNQD